jgi:hypothetical protein
MCTCGRADAHQIAQRTTADGVAVVLWSDGPVTGRMGYALPGVPVARPEGAAAVEAALAAGWLLMGEASLYDAEEMPALYAACRWSADRGRGPGGVRARLARVGRVRIAPVWEVIRTDREGKPTVRAWRLPRVRWPGLAVWDHVSVGAKGARYEVMACGRDGVCFTTGLRFSTLAALAAHLESA